ncbi:MAG TPA: STAS domain-containing protein [Acidimicrobiia bacterium]|nr:STAS domain-containing protein [Acidimicrobiia bacterium]
MIERPLAGDDRVGTSRNAESGPTATPGGRSPPADVFGIDARDGAGELLLAVHGDVDLATAPLLQEALAHATASGRHPVVLDLADLRFMDAHGIGVIVRARQLLREQQGDLSIRSAAPLVRKMFSIVELDDLIEAAPSIDATAT